MLNHNEKTLCQNHRQYKLGKVRDFINFGENAISPTKAADTCQKFGEEKGVPLSLGKDSKGSPCKSVHFCPFSCSFASLFGLASSPAGSLPQGSQLNARKTRILFIYLFPFPLFKGQLQLHPRLHHCQGGETPAKRQRHTHRHTHGHRHTPAPRQPRWRGGGGSAATLRTRRAAGAGGMREPAGCGRRDGDPGAPP